MEEKVCPGCGVAVPADAVECPYCGAAIETDVVPVQNEPEPEPVKVQQKKASPLLLIVLLVAFVAACGIAFYFQRNAQYVDKIVETQQLMLDGGSKAESLCNETRDRWDSAIFDTGRDFNDSIRDLYSYSSTINTVSKIEENQVDVGKAIEELRNCPGKYKQLFATIENMYDPYMGLTSLAISPTGSLQTYSNAFAEYDTEFMRYYNQLDTQLEVLQE